MKSLASEPGLIVLSELTDAIMLFVIKKIDNSWMTLILCFFEGISNIWSTMQDWL